MDGSRLADLLVNGVGDRDLSGMRDLHEVWATVTAITPTVQIRRDGETASVTITASAEPIEQLQVGNRVLCWQVESQLILAKKRDRSLSIWDTPRIPASANLNNYIIPGQYYNPLSAEVAGFTNGPPSGQAGALVVLESAGIIQYWHEYNVNTSDGNTWRRRFYSGAWSAWVPVYGPIMAEKIYIDGVGYDTSGYWGLETLSSPNYTTGAVYAWTLTKTFPALPPGDWSYSVHVLFSNGFTTVGMGNISQGQIRVTNVGSSGPTIRLGWQLVRGVT